VRLRIELTRSVIRSWRLEDIEPLVRHANNIKIWRNLKDSFPHPYTAATARQWIDVSIHLKPETHFAIEVDDQAAGAVGFDLKDDIYRRSGEIGYWLGEQYWGRGITSEALAALTEYAFNSFDICRLFAGVFEYNPASMRVLEKAGYVQEARHRMSVTKAGQTVDEIIYAMVRKK
jgi:ribosomal-protein-alanine N-acetyltransferase